MVFFGEAGPQDLIYGIHHRNIADRLTRRNWKTQAVVRCDWKNSLYLWVTRGHEQDADGRRRYTYCIHVYPHQPKTRSRRFEARFHYLTDALRYINGEDESLLATRTWPAHSPLLYPPEQEAPFYIGFGRPRVITPRG